MNRITQLSVILTTLAFAPATSFAADGSWSVNASGNWSDTANWSGGIVADGPDFTATLANVITADRIITLDANYTIGNIGVPATSASYTISGGNVLTLDRTDATQPTISVTSAVRTLTIDSVIAGNDGLLKTLNGSLTLAGNNTYSGGTTLSLGRLNIGNAGALSSGALTVSGASSIDNTSGSGMTLSGNNVFNINANLTFAGTDSLSNGTGGYSIDGNRQITVTANKLTLGGNQTDGGTAAITKLGAGTLTLLGTADRTGGTQINAGTVEVGVVADGGVASSLGAGTGSLGNFDQGTLRYVGSANASTNRGFRMGSAGIAIESSGAGTLSFTGGTGITFNNAGTARTFTLGGTNTGDNIFGKVIANQSGTAATSLLKVGAGKWILNQTNTYTGTTFVEDGVLLVNGSTAAGSAVSVDPGAVFGGSGTVNGNLTLNSGALFAFDTLSTLNLVGTLVLDNSFAVSSLRNPSGGAVNWASVDQGTYTLMNTSFTFDATTISNFGVGNQATGLSGKSAYFQQGTSPTPSLQLVVVPEPTALVLAALGLTLSGFVVWRRR